MLVQMNRVQTHRHAVRGPGAAVARPAPRAHAARWSAGFTMVEMMTVLAIVGIIVSFAVPSFVSMTQSNRVSSQVNSFVGDLQFARSEAIKEGSSVTLCPSSDGARCLGASTWQSGWIVFADANGNQSVDAGELVIRKQLPWTSTDTFVSTNSVTALTYSRDGFAVGVNGAFTVVLHTTPVNSNATRCVTVNVVGRQQVLTSNGTTCT